MEMEEVQIIRSSRKTLSLQIKPDGSVLVRAPLRLPEREIRCFLREKSGWIEKHLASVREMKAAGECAPLTMEEIRALAQRAVAEVPPRVRFFAAQMGVSFGRITIRNQLSRWGSCSGDGNLNFNCLLMLAPPEILDYVIVHELSHRIQMNHSPAFWAEVAKVLPDYKSREKWLKTEGKTLLARMNSGRTETE